MALTKIVDAADTDIGINGSTFRKFGKIPRNDILDREMNSSLRATILGGDAIYYEPAGSATTDGSGDTVVDLSATFSEVKSISGLNESGSALSAPEILKIHRQENIAHDAEAGGPFVVGEVITGGTSSATGLVTVVNSLSLDFVVLTGTFQSGEVLTGGTSSATANSTAVPGAVTLKSLAFRTFVASTGSAETSAGITFEYLVIGTPV